MKRKKLVCNRCKHVHQSDYAVALDRFSPRVRFVAKHGTLERATREEAERDECALRISFLVDDSLNERILSAMIRSEEHSCQEFLRKHLDMTLP